MKFKKFYYKKIKSTNDKALKHIKKGDEKGIILTNAQTKGKGQRGKNWISLKGNLFMSVFFEIKNKSNLKKITNLNCYLVRDCLQKLTNFKISIKRPNDLLIKKQKICGILQETVQKNSIKYLIIGIGLNLVKSPNITSYPTTNMYDLTNKKISLKKISRELKIIYKNFLKSKRY